MATRSNKDIFENTGKEFLSLLEKEKPVDYTEIDANWLEIKRATSHIKKKRTIYRISSGVAAIICLAFLSTYIYLQQPLTNTESPTSFYTESLDDINEVTLLTEGQNLILENETEVEYDEEGKASVRNQVISDVSANDNKKAKKTPNQIIVPNGKRSYLVLTDGTRLSVNSGSRVVYPAIFDDDKREIFVQGEVYLQVAPDAKRPFYVKTEKFDVRVLGTSFNVNVYKGDPEASIVLVEGAVEMISSKKETVQITPGQKLSIGNDGMSITNVDVNEYILWKDNILYLGNYKSCGEILTRLARQYDVIIEYDNRLENTPIGGKLDVCESIDDVLDILSVSAKFTYEWLNNRIIIKPKINE